MFLSSIEMECVRGCSLLPRLHHGGIIGMIKPKLTRVGNSTAVVLPKEVLQRLKLERGIPSI